MWSPDFLGSSSLPKSLATLKSERAHMNIDDTMIAASSRQAVGSLLGGGTFHLRGGPTLFRLQSRADPYPVVH